MNDTTTIERPPTTGPSDPADALATAERSRERAEALAIFAFVFAAISVLTALFAVGLSVRAVQRADSIENPPAVSGAPAGDGDGVTVTLTEFKITPNEIQMPAGSVLTVVNDGTTAHDVMVDGYKSETLDGGGRTTLDLTMLEPGTYDVICTVTGHKDSGMTATLTVV
jgi:plastocyanin